MRLPFRDVIPSRTRAYLAPLLLLPLAGFDVWRHAEWLDIWQSGPALLLSGVCLVGLGETLEDQLGVRRLLLLTGGGAACLALGPAPGPLATTTAAWVGAYLALYPHSKLLVWAGPRVVEVPVPFVAACWALTVVLAWPPAQWPLCAAVLLLGLVAGRPLRRPGRGAWAHFDHWPDR